MVKTAQAGARLIRQRTKRWVRMLVDALERRGMADEGFGLRKDLIAAGATDTEFDGIAGAMAICIVKVTEPTSSARNEQFGLIVDHLACTYMRIELTENDDVLDVEFPYRATIQ